MQKMTPAIAQAYLSTPTHKRPIPTPAHTRNIIRPRLLTLYRPASSEPMRLPAKYAETQKPYIAGEPNLTFANSASPTVIAPVIDRFTTPERTPTVSSERSLYT